jgi:hypothetical protein
MLLLWYSSAAALLLISCFQAVALLFSCCSAAFLLLLCVTLLHALLYILQQTSILSSKSRSGCSSILLSYLFWEQFEPIFLKRSRRFNGCINCYILHSLLRLFLGLIWGWNHLLIIFFHSWSSDPCKKKSINSHRPTSADILSVPNRNIILRHAVWLNFHLVLRIWIRDPGSGAFLTPGSRVRNCFFSGSRIPNPWSRIPDPNPHFWELTDNFLGKKFYNSLKISPIFFLHHFKNKIIFNFVKFVVPKMYDSKFFSPLSFVAVFGSGIRDPGSGLRDPGSGIRALGSGLRAPQHCFNQDRMKPASLLSPLGLHTTLFEANLRSHKKQGHSRPWRCKWLAWSGRFKGEGEKWI